MPPPSDPAPSARSSPIGKISVWLLFALIAAAALTYIAANPTRLMAKARYVGPVTRASEAVGEKIKSTVGPCPVCADRRRSSASEASDYTSVRALPDGRRTVTLGIPDPNGSSSADESNIETSPRQLVITSDDSPKSKVVLIGKAPSEMRSLVGVTDDGLLVTSSAAPPEDTVVANGGRSDGAVILLRFGIVGNAAPVIRTVANRPSPGAIRENTLSKDGSRILWAIRSERKPYAIAAWAARYLPSLAQYGSTRTLLTLWETTGEGKAAIKIGTELQPLAVSSGKPIPIPGNFAYEPDGKHIRFAFGGDEFDVPAPARN